MFFRDINTLIFNLSKGEKKTNSVKVLIIRYGLDNKIIINRTIRPDSFTAPNQNSTIESTPDDENLVNATPEDEPKVKRRRKKLEPPIDGAKRNLRSRKKD